MKTGLPSNYPTKTGRHIEDPGTPRTSALPKKSTLVYFCRPLSILSLSLSILFEFFLSAVATEPPTCGLPSPTNPAKPRQTKARLTVFSPGKTQPWTQPAKHSTFTNAIGLPRGRQLITKPQPLFTRGPAYTPKSQSLPMPPASHRHQPKTQPLPLRCSCSLVSAKLHLYQCSAPSQA